MPNKLTLQEVISLPDGHCRNCGAPFIEDFTTSHMKKNRKRFCSKKCWAIKNRGKQKEYNKKWHSGHPNYSGDYYRKNRKKIRAYLRDYFRKNREKMLAKARKRYAMRKKKKRRIVTLYPLIS